MPNSRARSTRARPAGSVATRPRTLRPRALWSRAGEARAAGAGAARSRFVPVAGPVSVFGHCVRPVVLAAAAVGRRLE